MSLVIDSGEDLPIHLLSGSYCKLLQRCELIGVNVSPLIRHGASSTFSMTLDACVSPVLSQAGRNPQRGNSRNTFASFRQRQRLQTKKAAGIMEKAELYEAYLINTKSTINIYYDILRLGTYWLRVKQTAELLCHSHQKVHKVKCGWASVWRERLCCIKMLTLLGGGHTET